ncbi:MAG: DMT family transporter [Firmicutes bacterium]|nr:DMT family transporter [Bacillota bacterium]
MRSSRAIANSVLVFITFIWGATFTLTKAALVVMPVFPYLALRFLLATIAVSQFFVFGPKYRKNLRNGRLWLIGIVLGALLFLGYALQTLGLQTIAPAVSAFLTGLSVIIVPIMSIYFLHQKSHTRTWLAALMAIIGLGLLNGGLHRAYFPVGTFYTLACAVFWALQIVAVDKWALGYDSVALTGIELLVVTLLSFLISLFTGPGGFHNWLSPIIVLAVVVNGLLGTAFAYWAQLHFQRQTSASYVAVIFTMEPVFAAVIAWVALHENLSAMALAGGLLIVSSMLIADASGS